MIIIKPETQHYEGPWIRDQKCSENAKLITQIHLTEDDMNVARDICSLRCIDQLQCSVSVVNFDQNRFQCELYNECKEFKETQKDKHKFYKDHFFLITRLFDNRVKARIDFRTKQEGFWLLHAKTG